MHSDYSENLNSTSLTFKAFVFLYITASMGLFTVFFIDIDPISGESSPQKLFFLSWIILYVITIFIFIYEVLRGRKLIRKSEQIIYIIPLVFFASLIWSNFPHVTLKYSISILANALFVVLLYRKFSIEFFMIFLRNTIIFLCITSMIFYFAGFELVNYRDIHNRYNLLGGTPLRGFFYHKIVAGYVGTIGIILCWLTLKSFTKYSMLLILIYFILLTGSSAAIIIIILSFFSLGFLRIAAKNRLSVGLVIFVLLLVGFLPALIITFIGDNILEVFNRDITLTGRTTLWLWGLETIYEKPLLGWGYHGYMQSPEGLYAASQITQFANYNVPHFHNSFIQIIVFLGIPIGLFIIYVLYKTITIIYKKLLSKEYNSNFHIAQLMIFIMLFLSAGAVHTIGRYNDFAMIFILYTMATSRKNTCHFN